MSAGGHEDTVSSRYLIRDGLGKEYKPEDYGLTSNEIDLTLRTGPPRTSVITGA